MFITANTLRVEDEKLYGTILWKREFSKRVAGVRITFNGEPIDELSLIFRSICMQPSDITENALFKVYVSDGISVRTYSRAIIEIFAAIFEKVDE